MLEFLGTVGGAVLGLPGVLGLALGMMTRNPIFGGVFGAVVAVIQAFIFAKFDFGNIAVFDLVIAIGVGVLAGVVGSAIRVKGTVA
ncbi:hypothetical protein [Shimia biformata]|uniref:hypothetical protein n=1 Tax=Shimia biformata TaxID=1294299 RepID=UPI001951AA49|nr:hypothetical protein [Shimia biformata]